MSSLDRVVSGFRRFLEDRLPWYDREEEREKVRRTEEVRQRSIKARMRAEAVLAQHRLDQRLHGR